MNCPFGVETATECQVSGLEAHTGTFAFGKTLHVLSGGHIDGSGGGITLNITGDLVVDSGGIIEGDDVTGNDNASNVTITVSGNTDLAAGSRISARNTVSGGHGGDISITVTGDMTMHGTPAGPGDPVNCRSGGTGDPLVYATPSLGAVISARGSGSSGNSPAGNVTIHVGNYGVPPSGMFTMERCSLVDASSVAASAGDIEIISGRSGDVDGLVLSESTLSGTGANQAPGGGPITIKAGCDLTVSDSGYVSSKGQDPGADLVLLKGCDVTIDGVVQSTTTAGHALPNNPANHCNDDTVAHPNGLASGFTACVRIIGRNITIDASGAHNGNVNVDGVRAPMKGWIDIFATKDIKILGDPAPAAKWAVSANGASSGPDTNTFGGLITIKNTGADGGGDITTSGQAVLEASTIDSGTGSDGGDIQIEAQHTVSLDGSYIEARGFVGINNSNNGGIIAIKAYNGAITSGGDNTGHINATGGVNGAPGQISLIECAPTDTYLGTVTPAASPQLNNVCGGAPTLPADAQALVDANEPIWNACNPQGFNIEGIKYKDTFGGATLDGWTIRLYDEPADTVHDTQVTGPPNLPGEYNFGPLDPGTYKVCEVLQPGWTQTAPTLADPGTTSCTGPGEAPVGYLITLNANVSGKNFANTQPPTCKEDPNRAAKITQQVDAGLKSHGGSAPVFATVSAAYLDAKNKTGQVIGIYTPTKENIVVDGPYPVTFTECETAKETALDNSLPVWDVKSNGNTIVSPTTYGGTIGWLIESNKNDIKSIRAYNASQVGVQISGSNNGVSFNEVKGSPTGIQISGGSNTLKNGSIDGNGTGVLVTGSSNTLQGMYAYSNTGDGFRSTGAGTYFNQNKSEKNGGIGFYVVSGAGQKFKDNQSNTSNNGGSKENAGAEYKFGVAVTMVSGNKKDNVSFSNGAVGTYEN